MPPALASLLTLAFVSFLFWRDNRQQDNVTAALWIPFVWLFLIGSRYVSQWLAMFGFSVGGVSVEEGSPLDAIVFLGLIAIGLLVLVKRRARFSEFARNNGWLTCFLVYCLIAIAWSDFPLVAFKRWIKVIGHPIMVLVVFSEPDPEIALAKLMKRCGYLLFPISILFIKYYPQWGRGFDDWTGLAHNTGITKDKNALGYICLICGLYFFWNLLNTWKAEKSKTRTYELLLSSGLLGMIWWLLWIANAKTGLMCLLVGMLLIVFLGLQFVNKKLVGRYLVVGAAAFLAADLIFGISGQLIALLGRDSTLTDRTEVWHDVLEVPINPILGTGFESFWLGERRVRLSEKWLWQPNQAHNGYLETYLNLGLIGLTILIGLLIATYRKACRELLDNFEFGRFRLGLLFAIVLYNWTDATFKALHPLWFAFYIIAIDYPTFRSPCPHEVDKDLANIGHPEEEIAFCTN